MPSYLLTGRYTSEAIKGMAENTEDRTEATGAGLAPFGGRIDRYFMRLGGGDFLIIAELPDNETAMAFASIVVRSGTINNFEVTPLIAMTRMPDVFRAANKLTSSFRPPGVSKIVP